MKKLSTNLLLSLGMLLAINNSFAAKPGGYVGLAAGYTNVNIESLHDNLAGYKNNNAGGLGGRFFYGYNFNPNFGLEVGYSKFNRATAEYNGYDGYYYYNQKVTYNN